MNAIFFFISKIKIKISCKDAPFDEDIFSWEMDKNSSIKKMLQMLHLMEYLVYYQCQELMMFIYMILLQECNKVGVFKMNVRKHLVP